MQDSICAPRDLHKFSTSIWYYLQCLQGKEEIKMDNGRGLISIEDVTNVYRMGTIDVHRYEQS